MSKHCCGPSLQLQEELARCESLMSANLKQVIEATRKELLEWWDKCYYSRQQREEFRPYFSGMKPDTFDFHKLHFCSPRYLEQTIISTIGEISSNFYVNPNTYLRYDVVISHKT